MCIFSLILVPELFHCCSFSSTQSLWNPLSPVMFDSAYVHVIRDLTARKAALCQLDDGRHWFPPF